MSDKMLTMIKLLSYSEEAWDRTRRRRRRRSCCGGGGGNDLVRSIIRNLKHVSVVVLAIVVFLEPRGSEGKGFISSFDLNNLADGECKKNDRDKSFSHSGGGQVRSVRSCVR